jgi:WD40 repeat protein
MKRSRNPAREWSRVAFHFQWLCLVSLLLPNLAGAADPLSIRAVAFSPDGKLLAAACGEPAQTGAIVLWDGVTRKQLWQHTEKKGVPAVAFSPDGRTLAIGSYGTDATLLWNVDTGETRARFSGTGGVHQLAFSQAARTLAVCGYGRNLSLFDLNLRAPDDKEREHIRTLLAKLDDDSYEVREAMSKELLAIGFSAEAELRKEMEETKSAEVRVRTRRLRQELLSKPRAVLKGHTDEVLGVAFSPDGNILASGSKDGTVRIWDLASKQELVRLVPER